jgi:hypothetical protein
MNWDRSNCGIAQFEPQSLHSLVARYLRVRVKIMSNEAHPMKEARMPLPMASGATAFCNSSLIFANNQRVAPTPSVASGNSALRRGGHD